MSAPTCRNGSRRISRPRSAPTGWRRAAALAGRPPLDLRVNTLKADREKVARQLARLGVAPTPLLAGRLAHSAGRGPRRHPHVQAEEAFQRGRFEVQDEGSQLARCSSAQSRASRCSTFAPAPAARRWRSRRAWRIAARSTPTIATGNRLAPIFDRLKRAGARNVQVRPPAPARSTTSQGRWTACWSTRPAPAPAYGGAGPTPNGGSRRRRCDKRIEEQDAVLAQAARFVKPGGVLAYATCSLLPAENGERIAAFLRGASGFLAASDERGVAGCASETCAARRHRFAETSLLLSPRRTGTDGFFSRLLRRAD